MSRFFLLVKAWPNFEVRTLVEEAVVAEDGLVEFGGMGDAGDVVMGRLEDVAVIPGRYAEGQVLVCLKIASSRSYIDKDRLPVIRKASCACCREEM